MFNIRISQGLDKGIGGDALSSPGPRTNFWTSTPSDQHAQKYCQKEALAASAMMCLNTAISKADKKSKGIKESNKHLISNTEQIETTLPLALPADYKEKSLVDDLSESDEEIEEDFECADESSMEEQSSDNVIDEELYENTVNSCPKDEDTRKERENEPKVLARVSNTCKPVTPSGGKKRKQTTEFNDASYSEKRFSIGNRHEDIQTVAEPIDPHMATSELDHKEREDNTWLQDSLHHTLRSYEILKRSHDEKIAENRALLEEIETLKSSLNQAQEKAKDCHEQCNQLRQEVATSTQELARKTSYNILLLERLRIAETFIHQEYS